MGWAGSLDDLITFENERDHKARASATKRSKKSRETIRSRERHENPNHLDAGEVEQYYRTQCQRIQRYIDYYKQERQLLEQTRGHIPKHIQAIEDINKALQQVPLISNWTDEAKWDVVQGIEKQISSIIRSSRLSVTLSPKLLLRLNESATQILEKANALFRDLSQIVQRPADPRVSESTRRNFESRVELLEHALPKFEKDCQSLKKVLADLEDVQAKWQEYLDLYTALPLRLQRRLTIEELSRLHLQKEQEQFVSLNHNGCYELGGVSGSGKSIILVNRALRLANELPHTVIYVLTINRSLATQLQGTLELVNSGSLPENLRVQSLYDLFQECIAICRPPEEFRLIDDRSGERIDRSWRDFVAHHGRTAKQNVFSDKAVERLVNTLQGRTGSRGSALVYLRDEVVCVQSAYLPRDRSLYFDEQRMGRVFPLLRPQKEAVLKVVNAWEEYLKTGGLCDIHTVSLRAAELLDADNSRAMILEKIRADAILVDEAQDLSTVELIALRHLLSDPEGDNALFLTGDVCQKVYSKHQAIERAGLSKSSISRVLRKNFRNTRQILAAAFGTIASYPPPPTVITGNITKPELSTYSGSTPFAVNCTGVSQEEYVREVVRHIRNERVAVVTENPNLLEALFAMLSDDPKVKCVRVQSNADIDRWREIPHSPSEIAVFLSTFDAVKGFEFETVIVADVSETRRELSGGTAFDGIPPIGTLEGDFWRYAAKLYAACTRARNHLILTYSGKPSIFLTNSRGAFTWIRTEDRQVQKAITGGDSA